MQRGNRWVTLVMLWLWPASGNTASPYEAVQQGNTLYHQGKYEEAAHQYATAAEQSPDAREIHFNLGNAAYKQHDYAKAMEHYARARQSTEPGLQSRATYNLGNAKYQQALQALKQPQEAIEHLRSAITYYRDSLDLDPQQAEARYNLELAHRLLQQLQTQQARQQSQAQQSQPQDQQQDQPQPQDQQQHAGQNQDQPPQQKQQPQDQQQQDQPQDQQTASSSRAQASPHHPDPPSQQTAASRELTPEEAGQLLETIRERAREADDRRQQWRRSRIGTAPVDKDW